MPSEAALVFSGLATLGTIPKIGLWVGSVLIGRAEPSLVPSGTDIVLVLGGLFAIFHSTVDELIDSFRKEGSSASFASRCKDKILAQFGFIRSFSEWMARFTRRNNQAVIETEQARREREGLENDQVQVDDHQA